MPATEKRLPVSGLDFCALGGDAQSAHLLEPQRLLGQQLCAHKISSPFAGLAGARDDLV